MTMGERIKQLRSANGFTQEMLAAKNKCVPFGDCKNGKSGKLKLFGLKNRNLQNYKKGYILWKED